MPVLVHDRDGLVGVPGTMGGYQQPQINLHTITRTFVGGVHPADAVAAPRWVVLGSDEGREPSVVALEPGVPEAARASLAAHGGVRTHRGRLVRARASDPHPGRTARWRAPTLGRTARPKRRSGLLPFGAGAGTGEGCETRRRTPMPHPPRDPPGSEPNVQRLLHDLDGIVWVLDAASGAYTYVSEGIRRLLGYAPEDWLQDPGVPGRAAAPGGPRGGGDRVGPCRLAGWLVRRHVPAPGRRRVLALVARRRTHDHRPRRSAVSIQGVIVARRRRGPRSTRNASATSSST